MNAFRVLKVYPLLFAGLVLWADGEKLPIRACEVFRIEGKESARIELRGSSNVQDWRATTHLLHVGGEEEIGFNKLAMIADRGKSLESKPKAVDDDGIRFSVPVASLEASNAKMLRDLKSAVGHPEHAHIEYRLLSATPDAEHENLWEITGRLKVAGEEREVSHRIEVQHDDENGWTVSGSMDLKMTSFGITPPRALLGLVRAHDAFTVDFKFQVESECTLLADRSSERRASGN
ncbi:MAG: YceI family protein [Verrucomicrobia bacterium]|nr:YceI family protein [Verrucomicrobiota bacterium]MCH8511368.1 YceI family protein [Kiritimatiellia bacterium]